MTQPIVNTRLWCCACLQLNYHVRWRKKTYEFFQALGPETCVAQRSPSHSKTTTNKQTKTNKNTTRIVYTGKKVRTPFLTMSVPKFSVKSEVAIVIFFLSLVGPSQNNIHSQNNSGQSFSFLVASVNCWIMKITTIYSLLYSRWNPWIDSKQISRICLEGKKKGEKEKRKKGKERKKKEKVKSKNGDFHKLLQW